jgi:hypothetical protein
MQETKMSTKVNTNCKTLGGHLAHCMEICGFPGGPQAALGACKATRVLE